MTVFGAPQRTRREREREAGGSAAGGAAARAPPRPYLAHGRSSSSLGIAGAASRGRDTSRLPASVLGRQPPRRAVTAPDSSARPPRQSRYRRLLRDDEAEALELLGGGTGGAGGAMRPVTPVVQALGPELRSSLTRSRGLVAELDAERGRLRGLVAQAGGSTARLERLAAGAPAQAGEALRDVLERAVDASSGDEGEGAGGAPPPPLARNSSPEMSLGYGRHQRRSAFGVRPASSAACSLSGSEAALMSRMAAAEAGRRRAEAALAALSDEMRSATAAAAQERRRLGLDLAQAERRYREEERQRQHFEGAAAVARAERDAVEAELEDVMGGGLPLESPGAQGGAGAASRPGSVGGGSGIAGARPNSRGRWGSALQFAGSRPISRGGQPTSRGGSAAGGILTTDEADEVIAAAVDAARREGEEALEALRRARDSAQQRADELEGALAEAAAEAGRQRRRAAALEVERNEAAEAARRRSFSRQSRAQARSSHEAAPGEGPFGVRKSSEGTTSSGEAAEATTSASWMDARDEALEALSYQFEHGDEDADGGALLSSAAEKYIALLRGKCSALMTKIETQRREAAEAANAHAEAVAAAEARASGVEEAHAEAAHALQSAKSEAAWARKRYEGLLKDIKNAANGPENAPTRERAAEARRLRGVYEDAMKERDIAAGEAAAEASKNAFMVLMQSKNQNAISKKALRNAAADQKAERLVEEALGAVESLAVLAEEDSDILTADDDGDDAMGVVPKGAARVWFEQGAVQRRVAAMKS